MMENKKNKGYTLVELIVVIAILAVATAAILIGMNLVSSKNADKASKLIKDILIQTRTKTLSINADWQAVIRNDNGELFMIVLKDGVEDEKEEIGTRIEIQYDNLSDAGGYVEEGCELIIEFKKTTGEIQDILYGMKYGEKESILSSEFRLLISGSDNTETLSLWKDTGKVTYEE